MKIEKSPGNEKIVKITVPNEDMKGWIETLIQEGFEQKEIDLILGHLNKEYAKVRGLDTAEKRLNDLKKYLFKEHGRIMTPEMEEHHRKNFQKQIDRE